MSQTQTKKLPNIWLLIASGVLLTLAFPPFDLLIPPFIALVPLFYFVKYAEETGQLLWGGLLVGILFWISLLYWVTLFSISGFIALVLYLSFFPLIFLFGLEFLWKRASLPLWLVGPSLWITLEHFRAIGELAFTWGQLCYSLPRHPLPLQIAEVSGPYGVSFWIVLVNTLVYSTLTRSGRSRTVSTFFLSLVILLPIIYGVYCFGREDLRDGEELKISLIQPNIDQDRKWSHSYRDSTIMILEELSREALKAGPDLVVWPETAVPAYIRHNDIYRGRVSRLVAASGIPYLVGSQDYEKVGESDYQTYNSAFLFRSTGHMDFKPYSKIRLVPFGEKLPYESLFPGLRDIKYGGGHFSPGEEFTLFDIDAGDFGVLICFESIFPELSRQFCLEGANFLLNITNDAWFLRTSAPYQHASVLPLRAIENRIYIGRSANTGVTMIVDPLGRINESTPIFTKMVISGIIHARNTDTFYQRHGDLVVYLSWIILLVALIFLPLRRGSMETRGEK
jgi:apolipoprotein N-acyltransferase